MITISTYQQQLSHQLEAAGFDNAAREAAQLVQFVTGKSALEVVLHADEPLSQEMEEHGEALLKRRLTHEPLAYILGFADFWGLRFAVNPHVLIPRPDSETLVATLCALLPEKNVRATVADIGTGSGCLLLSILQEYPQFTGVGGDISAEALKVAQGNAVALGVHERCTFTHGHMLEVLTEPVEILMSNPPYISTAEMAELDASVVNYEPHGALTDGEDGLTFYRELIEGAPAKLSSGGILLLEIGHTQKVALEKMFSPTAWSAVECYTDLAGRDRVMAAVKKE